MPTCCPIWKWLCRQSAGIVPTAWPDWTFLMQFWTLFFFSSSWIFLKVPITSKSTHGDPMKACADLLHFESCTFRNYVITHTNNTSKNLLKWFEEREHTFVLRHRIHVCHKLPVEMASICWSFLSSIKTCDLSSKGITRPRISSCTSLLKTHTSVSGCFPIIWSKTRNNCFISLLTVYRWP